MIFYIYCSTFSQYSHYAIDSRMHVTIENWVTENISFLPSHLFLIREQSMELIKNIEIHFDNPSNSSKIELISSMRIIEFQIFPEISSVFTSVSTRRKACNASVPHNAAAWAQGRQRLRVLIKRPSSPWRVCTLCSLIAKQHERHRHDATRTA